MKFPLSNPVPRALAYPMRDLLRGLRQPASMSRTVLSPVADLLPAAMREGMDRIISGAADRMELPSGTLVAAIDAASLTLRHGGGAVADVVEATSYGIGILLAAIEQNDALQSDTVTAFCWQSARHADCPAAAFAIALDARDVVGPAPGLLHTTTPEMAADRRRIVLAVIIWLLATRASEGISETDLVQFAGWIAGDVIEEAAAVWHDPTALQALLLAAAERL